MIKEKISTENMQLIADHIMEDEQTQLSIFEASRIFGVPTAVIKRFMRLGIGVTVSYRVYKEKQFEDMIEKYTEEK